MQFDSVIEICKNRSLGILDYFVGMYYEIESRRLKNSISEHIIYGWEDNPIEQRLSDNISFPFEPNHGEETPF